MSSFAAWRGYPNKQQFIGHFPRGNKLKSGKRGHSGFSRNLAAYRRIARNSECPLFPPFGTMTRDLLARLDWPVAEYVSHGAMESTGMFWKPIYNILEGQSQILLVNALHSKNVPGRKTDVIDCEWIAPIVDAGARVQARYFVPCYWLKSSGALAREPRHQHRQKPAPSLR
jgi:hypothetical protein